MGRRFRSGLRGAALTGRSLRSLTATAELGHKARCARRPVSLAAKRRAPRKRVKRAPLGSDSSPTRHIAFMATSSLPKQAPGGPPDLDTFEHHWQDEADAAFLYRAARGRRARSRSKQDIYRRLADGRGPARRDLGRPPRQHGRTPARIPSDARARDCSRGSASRFGPGFLLPMLLAEEGREVKGYLDMHRQTPRGAPGATRRCCSRRSRPSTRRRSMQIAGRTGEPWHRTECRRIPAQRRLRLQRRPDGELRSRRRRDRRDVATPQHHAVIVAGVAGLIADALSMGSSGYLAAKSEQEVYANEIAMERDEIALMPEIERDELALIYEAKGMDRESAHALATQVMADPERCSTSRCRRSSASASRTCRRCARRGSPALATAIGALIPVFPFFVSRRARRRSSCRSWSRWLSHWVVGAARSVFTGRSVFRSGLDMFVVGLGVAAVGLFRRRVDRDGCSEQTASVDVSTAALLGCHPELHACDANASYVVRSSASPRARLPPASAQVSGPVEPAGTGAADAIGLLRPAVRRHGGYRASGRPPRRRSRRRLRARRRGRVRASAAAVLTARRAMYQRFALK